jgi:alpha-L-fucosidase
MSIYEQTVGRGGQLVLGIAPDRRGLLPEADVQRLKEFGESIQRRYGKDFALKHVRGAPEQEQALDGNPDTFWSAPPGSHHSVLEVNFEKPVTFDRALVMEWLNDGQHVEEYAIEVLQQNHWVEVSRGHAIGHKKIDLFPAVTASHVRLNILSSRAEAHIREFELFNAKDPTKH